jgi:hypothetical protein
MNMSNKTLELTNDELAELLGLSTYGLNFLIERHSLEGPPLQALAHLAKSGYMLDVIPPHYTDDSPLANRVITNAEAAALLGISKGWASKLFRGRLTLGFVVRRYFQFLGERDWDNGWSRTGRCEARYR